VVDGLVEFSALHISLLCFPQDVAFVQDKWQGRVVPLKSSIKLYSLRELCLLGRTIEWSQFDLFHVPHFTLPLGVPIPSVVTVHDLIQLTHPERWYYPLIASIYLNSTIERAQRIIAVSNHTAGQLISRGADRATVEVIPNSVGLKSTVEFANACLPPPLEPGYFLSVLSNNKPHKGLQRLLDAYAYFSTHFSERAKLPAIGLVVVGAGAPIGSFPGGIGMGMVTESELACYYAHARSVVVASSIEGFCLPIIEGREYGVPAVSTPIPAVLELCCAHDTVAHDFSIESVARALSECLVASVPCKESVKNTNSKYRLNEVTNKLLLVYTQLLGRSIKRTISEERK